MAKEKSLVEEVLDDKLDKPIKDIVKDNKHELEKENIQLKKQISVLEEQVKELQIKIEDGRKDSFIHVDGKQYKIVHKGDVFSFAQELKMRNIPDNHLCVSLELVS